MNLLFLCTGNSCRSQMAEGWARHFFPNHLSRNSFEIQSAGIEAHGKNPRAIAVMQEAGVDIAMQESSKVTEAMLEQADLVVTVCGHADEHCPALPVATKKQHWPLDDPAKAEGSEEEIMQVFRASRDEIKNRVRDLLQHLSEATA